MYKIILIIVAITILYSLFVYGKIAYIVRSANNPQLQQQVQMLGNGQPLKYLALGDSTSVGIGTQSIDQAYPNLIAKALSEKAKIDYNNLGTSGAKTDDLVQQQLQNAIDFQPDIVTISIGANDVTHMRKSETIIQNLKEIVSQLENKTNAQIFIANIPDFSGVTLLPKWYIKLIEHKSKPLNETINSLSSPRVHVVPIHEIGPVPLSKDNFHPNAEGYKIWAETFIKILTDHAESLRKN